MTKYICIHGHFYQPPRENPWLETIEIQDSAYPYHDWNERVTAECYAPNRAARILNDQGLITDIVNNYSKMSFNFGPTLLSWLEVKNRTVYQGILEADVESQKRFSGHGSAMAQAYNHLILPLANSRDKFTQIFWGIKDFEYRFKRMPEGMWLPETAVDLESLDMMAQCGIKFTILAPYQAARIRKLGDSDWTDVEGGKIDPTMPYMAKLPSGKTICIFFYDGPVSRAVAFEGILSKGEYFSNRLMGSFANNRAWNQLVHIATDGETYGHHHRYGEMALAYALRYIEENKLAQITNYSEFLEKFPPTHEVEIFENTSWSCAHGIERWRSNCGCRISSTILDQSWRAPLRQALDFLRDEIWPVYEDKARSLFQDLDMARNDYISVILNRDPANIDAYLSKNTQRPLNHEERVMAIKLLELQRNCMLMYTSCGWFFDDISGIEASQVLRYAGRVLELAVDLFDLDLEPPFLTILEQAKSSVPEKMNGSIVFDLHVRPTIVDLHKVAAHYAMSSLFHTYEKRDQVYCFSVERSDYKIVPVGKARMATGKLRIISDITTESADIMFGAFHFGDHNLSAGTRAFESDELYEEIASELEASFSKANWPEFFRDMQRIFGDDQYSPKDLFFDEQRKILNLVLDSTLKEAESSYRHIYDYHAPLMNYLTELNIRLPKPLLHAAEFTLNTSLKHELGAEMPDVQKIDSLMNEARRTHITLDKDGLSYTFRRTLQKLMKDLKKTPYRLDLLKRIDTLVGVALMLPFGIEWWKIQNIYYDMLHDHYAGISDGKAVENEAAQEWIALFLALGKKLRVNVPQK